VSKFEVLGARLCAQRQPQFVENDAAGLRHSRAPNPSGIFKFVQGTPFAKIDGK
jgi:hypothetical protein